MNEGEKKSFHYLDDNEIILDDSSDLIGTSIYTGILERIICNTSTNKSAETIALLGGWGSGKSSIIKSLENNLTANNQKINGKGTKFYVYNAWKYNNDNFRKTFLINCTIEKKKTELEKKLYQSSSETIYELNNNYKLMLFFAFCLFLIFFLMTRINLLPEDDNISKIISIIPNLLISTVISWSLTTILKSIIVEKKVSTSKEFSPQDFSDMFKEYRDNKYYSIYVIDDLDRCTNSQVLEILETIHGFLKDKLNNDISDYVFLIPIDKHKIYKILNSERDYDINDSNEYFNKLFDVTVSIDLSEKYNMYNMLKYINNMYVYDYTPMSLNLISEFLVKTPREIKRNINELNLLRTIITEKKKDKYIDSNNLSNTEEITKLYILKKNWPEIYYEVLQLSILGNKPDDEILKLSKKEKSSPTLVNFLRLSSYISVNSIRTFEYLKESKIGNNDKVESLIVSGDVDEISNIINTEFDINQLIDSFGYAHRKFVGERNLAHMYSLGFFDVYVFIFEKSNNEQEIILQNTVGIKTIISDLEICYLTRIDEKEKEKFSIGLNSLSELMLKKKNSVVTDEIIKTIISYSLRSSNYDQIFEILSIDKELDYLEELTRKDLFNNLVNNWKKEYDHKLTGLIYDTRIYDEYLSSDNIDIFIEDNSKNIIGLIAEKNSSLLKNRFSRIIEVNDVESVLSKPIQNDTENENMQSILMLMTRIDDKEFYSELNTILVNTGISQFSRSIMQIEDKESARKIVTSLFKIFYSNYSPGMPNLFRIQKELFSQFVGTEFRKELELASISSNQVRRLKVEYIFYLLSQTSFEEPSVTLFINEINKIEDDEDIEYITNILKRVYNSQSTINVALEKLNINISLSYQSYISKIFPRIIELNYNLLYSIVQFTHLQTIFSSTKVYEYIKNMRKSKEVYSILVSKISQPEDYKELMSFVTRSTHSVAIHEAMKRLLVNVTSMNYLLELHNINGISPYEISMIKQAKLDKFRNSSTAEFGKIVWSDDEKVN